MPDRLGGLLAPVIQTPATAAFERAPFWPRVSTFSASEPSAYGSLAFYRGRRGSRGGVDNPPASTYSSIRSRKRQVRPLHPATPGQSGAGRIEQGRVRSCCGKDSGKAGAGKQLPGSGQFPGARGLALVVIQKGAEGGAFTTLFALCCASDSRISPSPARDQHRAVECSCSLAAQLS